MSDKFSCKIEECEWDGDTLPSLRSHVSASKDDDHQEARKAKAWEQWYPDAEGASEGGSDPSDEGTADPADDDREADPSEPSDGEGDDGGSTAPSDGGPDPSEEYAEQWGEGETAQDTQESKGSDGGSDPSDDGGSGSSDRAGGDDNGIGAGVALVAGSALVGLIALLARKDDDPEPIEVESTAEDVDVDAGGKSTPSEGGWSTVEEGDGW